MELQVINLKLELINLMWEWNRVELTPCLILEGKLTREVYLICHPFIQNHRDNPVTV